MWSRLLARRLRFRSLLAADSSILDLFFDAQTFAFASHRALVAHRAGSTVPLSVSALQNMAADIWALSGATLELCMGGWAFACPILLRTTFEILLGAAAVHNDRASSEYLAFKYLFAASKQQLLDAGAGQKLRKSTREQARRFIAMLPAADQKRARDYVLKGKMRDFWYSPEYGGPTELIKRFSNPEMLEVYRWLSSSSHGGMLGLKAWRDAPDVLDPGARRDPASQNRALAISSRLLLNFAAIRLSHENYPLAGRYDELMGRANAARGVVERSFKDAMAEAARYAAGKRDRMAD